MTTDIEKKELELSEKEAKQNTNQNQDGNLD